MWKIRAYALSPDLTKDVLAVCTVDYKRHSIPLSNWLINHNFHRFLEGH